MQKKIDKKPIQSFVFIDPRKNAKRTSHLLGISAVHEITAGRRTQWARRRLCIVSFIHRFRVTHFYPTEMRWMEPCAAWCSVGPWKIFFQRHVIFFVGREVFKIGGRR